MALPRDDKSALVALTEHQIWFLIVMHDEFVRRANLAHDPVVSEESAAFHASLSRQLRTAAVSIRLVEQENNAK